MADLFDRNGYPTRHAIGRIRRWSYEDFDGLIDFVHDVWWPQGDPYGWKQKGRTLWFSTGGWSGNEEVVGALRANLMFWTMCWDASWRGGHFRFKLPKAGA